MGVAEREASYKAADEAGKRLIREILDDPFVTEEQLVELTMRWEKIKSQVAAREGEVATAVETRQKLDVELAETQYWLNEAQSLMVAMAPVSHVDLASAEAQLQEIQVGFHCDKGLFFYTLLTCFLDFSC